MTLPGQFLQPGESLQRNARSARIYTDQHGRSFYAEADNATQQPIGELRPYGFVAQWLPPNRFAKFRKDGELTFTWDYTTMAEELSGDVASYYDAAIRFALENNLPVPEVGGVVDRRIKAVYDRAPLSPEIPLAAQAGDKWLLGDPAAPVVPELAAILNQGTVSTGSDALAQIKARIAARQAGDAPAIAAVASDVSAEPVTYQQFVREGRSKGMSMADLALAWKAHKDNLEPMAA